LFKGHADERGTPFVEVDGVVCDYIRKCEEPCIKEMFSRLTRSDGDAVALFPFQQLSHSFLIGGFGRRFDAEKEKRSNENLRHMLRIFKDRVISHVDKSNPIALRKAEHYIGALNAQLVVCDQTDENIDQLSSPPNFRTIKDIWRV